MRSVLITGGNGFIGSALTKALLGRGEHVHVFDKPAAESYLPAHPNLTTHDGDIRSYADVRSAMQGCSAAFHLAACACNWLPRNDDFFDVNVRGTKTFLDCAMEAGLQKVVVTSTNLTLGPSVTHRIDEGVARTTDFYNTYERSKVAADLLAYRYVLKGLNVVTVHPTRVFGPGPINEANSVTKMILWYLRGTWRLIPGSGNAVGNYVFLNDLIDGFIRAMAYGRSGEHYILGGENLSYNDLFSLVAAESGISRHMLRLPAWLALPFSSIQQGLAGLTGLHPLITPGWTKVFLDDWTTSCAKARDELGYSITPFRSAIQSVLRWFSETGLIRLPNVRAHTSIQED